MHFFCIQLYSSLSRGLWLSVYDCWYWSWNIQVSYLKNRFMYLLNYLRFDELDIGQQRREYYKTSSLTYIFNEFVNNCKNNYNMGINATIEEMLIVFCGRSHLIHYIPKKSAKNVLKVQSILFWQCFFCSVKGWEGKDLPNEEREFQVATLSEFILTRNSHGNNRNITVNNWYSSLRCIEEFKEIGLIFVGT